MTILIATGIYPPQVGGPAKYAHKLYQELSGRGPVLLCAWGKAERALPWGVRHLYYFLRLCPKVARADAVLALDTFSAGFPALVACRLLGKKLLVRVGGDPLWESYIERTGELTRLSDFYKTPRGLSLKERMLKRATSLLVCHADLLLFNTAWQMRIWQEAYGCRARAQVLENEYPTKHQEPESPSLDKVFVAAGRGIVYKNIPAFAEAFAKAAKGRATLDTSALPPREHMARVAGAYAYAVPSVSEVNSNNIIEALSYGVPFIAPIDSGMHERLRGLGVFVDTLDPRAMEAAVEELLDERAYQGFKERIRQFGYARSWGQIADEILEAGHTL